MRRRLRALVRAGIGCALALAAAPALAAQPSRSAAASAAEPDGGATLAAAEREGWAYELPKHLMSPFCPGRALADCTSPQAASLQLWLVVQEAAGRSRADVEAELFERYGDALRAAPRARGFGLTAYALPIAAFVAGGIAVAVFLRRQTRAAARRERAPLASD
ncbi:MAG TPA: cytochrome c-type biogenesis protein CcmH, partial [Myxococcota bacterium]|nr:cytochrome c-type biogenesis protein CcmH [Myxococcota bacterium]